jgi:DNA-directed RNA polymerase specialized sigma subunit
VRKAVRREARSLAQLVATDDIFGDRVDAAESSLDFNLFTVEAVATWVRGLSSRLQALYNLVYVHGCTQREVATTIGVSQPRVAQLHRQLLELGRVELAHLAA